MNARGLTLGALVALVVALALPSLNLMSERARRAKCLSNLKAIGAAMHVYAQDYNGSLPALSPLEGGVRESGENGFNRHADLLIHAGFGVSAATFVCPSDKEDGNPLEPVSDDGASGHACVRVAATGPLQWYNVSYLYVAGLTLRDGGDCLLLADEHWDSEGDCPAECRHDLDQFDNHGKHGRNLLYLDGRGEWQSGVRLDAAYETLRQRGVQMRTRTVD